jgi:hypothetical protein
MVPSTNFLSLVVLLVPKDTRKRCIVSFGRTFLFNEKEGGEEKGITLLLILEEEYCSEQESVQSLSILSFDCLVSKREREREREREGRCVSRKCVQDFKGRSDRKGNRMQEQLEHKNIPCHVHPCILLSLNL